MKFKVGYRLPVTVVVLGLFPLYFLLQHTPPDFTQYAAGSERKREFIEYLSPIVDLENTAVLEDRNVAIELEAAASNLSFFQQRKLEQLFKKYKVENFDPEQREHWGELLTRIDKVPLSLALAQAASESGWGTSRFAREGNNYFGQWCFTKGCGLVPKNRSKNKTHEVASFSSPADSVRAYIINLNHNQAYAGLRLIRANKRASSEQITGVELAKGLTKYSERGEEYVQEIKSLIQSNNLESTGS